jgi:H+-translocating NAD(P) transhydrogenase subunit beta
MPILDVDKARTVMVIKRSMSPGFAGIDNPLYYLDKTLMLFGDAKSFVNDIVHELAGGETIDKWRNIQDTNRKMPAARSGLCE